MCMLPPMKIKARNVDVPQMKIKALNVDVTVNEN